jgi:hypothetical protein
MLSRAATSDNNMLPLAGRGISEMLIHEVCAITSVLPSPRHD